VTDGLDVSRLSPSDAATSFRSFARRFRALFSGFDEDESADAVLNRPGAAGATPAELAADAGRELAAYDEALRRFMVADEPDVSLGAEPSGPPSSPQEALDAVTTAAERLAGRVDDVEPEDWTRTGRAGGRRMTALDLVRDAVRAGSDRYRATERAVEESRRSL
jgi:hypothetical protein